MANFHLLLMMSLSSKNFLLNNATTVVYLGLYTVLTPWYITHVGAAAMGAWLACHQLVTLANMFDGGISGIILREIVSISDPCERKDAEQELLLSGFYASVISGLISVAVAIGIGLIAVRITNCPPEALHSLEVGIKLAGISGGLGFPFLMAQAAGQTWGTVRAPAVCSLLGTFAGFATSAIMVPEFGLTALGFGFFVTSAVKSGLALLWAVRQFVLRGISLRFPGLTSLSRLLQPAVRSLGIRLGELTLVNVETTLAAVFVSPEIATKISINGRLYSLCQIVAANYSSAHFTRLAAISAADPSTRLTLPIRFIFFGFVLCSSTMVACLAVNHTLIRMWVGESLYLGVLPGLCILLGRLGATMSNFFMNCGLASGLYSFVLSASLSEGFVRVGLQLVASNVLSFQHVSFAPLVSVSLVWIGGYFVITKPDVKRRVWRYRRHLYMRLPACLVCAATTTVGVESFGTSSILTCVANSAVVAVCVYCLLVAYRLMVQFDKETDSLC